MLKLSRILATSVATISLLGVAAFPANADPTPAPTPTVQTVTPKTCNPCGGDLTRSGTIKLNSGQKKYVDLAVKAIDPAHVNSKGQIDWNWVEDVFAGHPTSKNGFGAGWYARRGDWGQFTHLSTNDKKGIIKWAKTHGGVNPTLHRSMVERRAPKPCTGVTKFYSTDDGNTWAFLNSCDTDKMIIEAGTCAAAVAVIAAVAAVVTKGKGVPIQAALAGLACVVGAGWLTYAQEESTLDAVILRIGRLHSQDGSWQSPYWIYSQ